ncbi:MAG: PAS domain-containing protein [Gemmatimonadales bacterium]|nr:PAS domain-containing protein [Gemmatimonadales bacterium]
MPDDTALPSGVPFGRPVLDALGAHLALVGEDGRIVAVNRAWIRFAEANGDPGLRATCTGADYFRTVSDEAGAARVAAGMRAVLAGDLEEFEHEYPCHAPTEERWFTMRVTRLVEDGRRWLVVSHTNVTRRVVAQRAMAAELRESEAAEGRRLELASLEGISAPPASAATARAFGAVALREAAPVAFADLAERYGALIDAAVDARAFGGRERVAHDLRLLADELGFMGARPRDAVELHREALAHRMASLSSARAQALIEEGRLVALEVVGNLASYYRARAVGAAARTPLGESAG